MQEILNKIRCKRGCGTQQTGNEKRIAKKTIETLLPHVAKIRLLTASAAVDPESMPTETWHLFLAVPYSARDGRIFIAVDIGEPSVQGGTRMSTSQV